MWANLIPYNKVQKNLENVIVRPEIVVFLVGGKNRNWYLMQLVMKYDFDLLLSTIYCCCFCPKARPQDSHLIVQHNDIGYEIFSFMSTTFTFCIGIQDYNHGDWILQGKFEFYFIKLRVLFKLGIYSNSWYDIYSIERWVYQLLSYTTFGSGKKSCKPKIVFN